MVLASKACQGGHPFRLWAVSWDPAVFCSRDMVFLLSRVVPLLTWVLSIPTIISQVALLSTACDIPGLLTRGH